MRKGNVYVHGVYAGVICEDDSGKFEFTYDTEYVKNKEAAPVCLAMPTTQLTYNSDYLFPFFSNLLSEGENRKMQATYLGIDENDDFGILLETASYDTIGCVTVKKI